MTGSQLTVGVTTLVSGRRPQLARQLEGLAAQTRPADRIVVVRLDDGPVDVPSGLDVRVVSLPVAPGAELPLAAARNVGVRALGTDLVVLLDVDCIPATGLVAGYAAALGAVDGLGCGELRYLAPGLPGPGPLDEAALRAGSRRHPARPAPMPGGLRRDDRHALAWTTSLAMRRSTFDRLHGFDERYLGYGAEDTDFGERARLAGIGVWWTGDAVAFHQDHGTPPGPPVHHLAAVVRNATLFAGLHGWWPMRGWLDDFARRGLVDFDPDAGRLDLVERSPA